MIQLFDNEVNIELFINFVFKSGITVNQISFLV